MRHKGLQNLAAGPDPNNELNNKSNQMDHTIVKCRHDNCVQAHPLTAFLLTPNPHICPHTYLPLENMRSLRDQRSQRRRLNIIMSRRKRITRPRRRKMRGIRSWTC